MNDERPKPEPAPKCDCDGPPPEIKVQPMVCAGGTKCKAPAGLQISVECGQVQALMNEAYAANVPLGSHIVGRLFGLAAYHQAQNPSRN